MNLTIPSLTITFTMLLQVYDFYYPYLQTYISISVGIPDLLPFFFFFLYIAKVPSIQSGPANGNKSGIGVTARSR